MKKLPIGLVIEGNSTASALLRLPAITSELGPIKSSGLQVATRVSNFLDGGYGVANYNELSSARTILIRIPDASVDRVISEICKAEMVWQEHAFVLCETWVPTEKLEPLQKLGAAIASLVSLPTGNEKTFVLEGDLAAVRQLRRVIERANVRSIELKQGTKHLLFAATLLCSAIPTPLLLMAQQLRADLPQLCVITDNSGASIKSQFKKADKSGAVYAAIIGEQEAAAQLVSLKPLRTGGEQLSLGYVQLVEFLGRM